MKKIMVTRATHSATYKKCKNLGQLIATVEREGEIDGLYVIKILLNGKNMDEEEEKLLDSLSINEVDMLEVVFASMNEIVKDSILDIIRSIQAIQQCAISFAKEFRVAGRIDDEKIKYLLIQCRSVIESLEEIFKTHNNEKFLIRHHSLWRESEKELTNILQCIFQGRHMSDVGFNSDLIEYDLVQALDGWEEVLVKEITDNPSFTGIFSLKNESASSDNGVDA